MRGISLIGADSTFELQFAEGWHELTQDQFCAVAEARTMAGDKDALKVHLLRLLTGMTDAQFHNMRLDDLLELCSDEVHNEWVEACPWLNWLLEEPVLEQSMLPEVKHDGIHYQGPKSGLGNFTVLQLSFADLCLQALNDQPDEKALNNLLGALYHEFGTLWSNESIEERGLVLARLPLATKLGAVLNYQGSRATLPLRYPRTFRATQGKEDFGIDGLLESLAGDKFGEVDQVGSKPLHLALVHCERMLQREEELKAQTKTTT